MAKEISTDDIDFDELDKQFNELDDELSDLMGNKDDSVRLSSRSKNKSSDTDSEDDKSSKENFNIKYIIGTDMYANIYDDLFEKIQNLAFVIPGQLILHQEVSKDTKLKYLPGENVFSNKTFSHFFAKTEGLVCWRGNYITVQPVEKITDVMDPSAKQLDFNGSIIVETEVPRGIKIRAKGDVYIEKNIGDVEIYSEGNIFLINGITSRGEAKITAKNSIFAKFAENTRLRSGEDVIIEESAMNCKISCEHALEMVGKKQVLVGGEVTAGYFINCKILGSENYTKTDLNVGLLGSEKQQQETIREEMKKFDTDIAELNKKYSSYVVKKSEGSITEQEMQEMTDCKSQIEAAKTNKENCENKLKEIEKVQSERKNSNVSIENKVYPKVGITLNKAVFSVNKEMQKITFTYNQEKKEVIPSKFKRLKLEVEGTGPTVKKYKHEIIEPESIRRNIFLKGADLKKLQEQASDLLKISPQQLVMIIAKKEANDVRHVMFFEVKPKENKALIKKKARRFIKVENVTVQGATIEECLLRAEKLLEIKQDKLDYKIIQEGKSGLLGVGKKLFVLDVFRKEKKAAAVKSVDGKIIVENRIDDGLMLKVTSPAGNGKTIEVEDVLEFLQEKKYKIDIDKQAVRDTVADRPEDFVNIGPRQPEPELDGSFKISVSEDKMVAEIELTPPKKKGVFPVIDLIKASLEEQNIKKYNLEEVEAFCVEENKGTGKQKFVVAKGTKPVAPKPQQLELKIQTSGGIGGEEDQVDLKEKSSIVSVVQEQLLAILTKPEEGKIGYDVYETEIPMPDVEKVDFKAGKNVRVSDDGLKYFAEIDGWVVIDNNTIKVENIYMINGDVDYSTGNIHSLGSVMVKGSIKDGFKVEARGDVFVDSIENAQVVCEGNIIVKSGVQGKGGALLKCKGRFEAKFLEQANVEAGGNVIVTESILHSNVMAGQNIIVLKGKKGLIAGGEYMALNIVAAKNIGTKVATATEVCVGRDPFALKEFNVASKNYNKLKTKYESLKLNLKKLMSGAIGENYSERKKRDLLVRLTKSYKKLTNEVRDSTRNLKILQHKVREADAGYVMAKEKMFTNVTLNISKHIYKNTKEQDFCTFYQELGEVKYKEFDEITLGKYYKQESN